MERAQPAASHVGDQSSPPAMLRYVIFCCEARAQLLPSVAKCNKPSRRTTLLGRVLSLLDTVASSLLRLLFPLPFFSSGAKPGFNSLSTGSSRFRVYPFPSSTGGGGKWGWCTEGKSLDLQVQDEALGIHRVTPPDSDRICSVASGGKEYVRRWSSAARPISVTLVLCCSIL
jgi:hypothetical protein